MTPASKHTKLMEAMGSKSGEWDPIPPQQYERFEGMTNSQELRLWAAILKRTIGRGDDQTRSPFCRERNGRITQQANLAADLGMTAANVSSAMKRLEADGRIRRKDGKIWLRADVPAPDLLEEEAKEQRTEVLYAKNLNAEKIEFLQRLEQRSKTEYRGFVARLLAHEEWKAMVAAQAQGWVRHVVDGVEDQLFTDAGYTNTETRGRKKERTFTSAEQFQVPVTFPEFSKQKTPEFEEMAERFSIQNGKPILSEINSDSVQKPHPYVPELQSSESQLAFQGKVEAKPKTTQAELSREQDRSAVKNEITARLQLAKMTSLGAVKVDAGTLSTLANEIMRLPHIPDRKAVLDVLEERAREIKSGKRIAQGWGYFVNTVRGEVDNRLPANLKTQINAAAAGKGLK